MTSDIVDVVFAVRGDQFPSDHGYSLYAAISRIAATLHRSTDVGIFPIAGQREDNRRTKVTEASSLRIRLPQSRVREAICLAGKVLDLDGSRLHLGVPHLQAIVPAPRLYSRLVVIAPSRGPSESRRPKITPTWFLQSAIRKIEEMGISSASPSIPLQTSGQRRGEPQRRIVRIKGQTYAGYPLVVAGLNPGDSITLQADGLGGRRLMGCGLFVPARGET